MIAVGVVASCVPVGFGGQAGAVGPAGAASPGIAFVDKTFGFSMRVPGGWTYDRTGFFGPGGSLGVLRGASPDGRSSLQILVFREIKERAFSKWVEYFGQQLGEINGTQRVRVEGTRVAGRPAAMVVVDAKLGIDQTRTTYCCVRFDAGTIWVFSLAQVLGKTEGGGPGGRGDKTVPVPAIVRRCVESLHVSYSEALAERMAAALGRGRAYLARFALQEAIRRLRLDTAVHYYEIRIKDRPVGYMTRRFQPDTEPLQGARRGARGKEGLHVREESYVFADDGAVDYARIDLFSSRDGETDLYEIWSAHIATTEGKGPVVRVTRDQCVRERDTLFSTFATNTDRGLPAPRRPLKLDDSYLGLAWVRALPGLLGTKPQPAIGFTIYDTETRTLVTHVTKALGQRPLPGSAGASAYAYETRAGFVETPGMAYTDAYGNLLRFEAGDFVLQRSTRADVEKRFGARRDEAARRLKASGQRPGSAP